MKRKLFLSICALACWCASYAQLSSISGEVRESKAKEICFFAIEDGQAVVYARTAISPAGKFGFMIDIPAEGFYAVGFEGIRVFKVPVYLKPGDDAQLILTYNNTVHTSEFTKRNTPENLTLGRWLAMSETVCNKAIYSFSAGSGSTYEDFYPDMYKLLDQRDAFRKSIKTRNGRFNSVMSELVDFNVEYYALIFRITPRTKWPEEGYEYPAFYKTMIRPNRFADDTVLGTLHGGEYLSVYVDYAMENDTSGQEENSFMATDRLRGTYYLPTILRTKDYASYLVSMERYGKYLVTDNQRKAAEEKGSKLYETAKAGEAADFTYPDIDGNYVSLRDLRGKVVVVDVWATWCGPCKAQIPYMKKLIEQYKGRDDVAFVSISVDERNDYETWKKMVVEEGLTGIHLFADGWSKITKDYKIKGIPRFMVFGKDGKVVSADAPRPSQPELKAMIDNAISAADAKRAGATQIIVNDSATSEVSGPDIVKVPMQISNAMIIIRAECCGITGNFILDSGAPCLVLNSRYIDAEKNNLINIGQGSGINSSFDDVYVTPAADLSFNGIRMKNQSAAVVDLSPSEQNLGFDLLGLMGMSIYQDYDLLLDYENSVITFIRPELSEKYIADNYGQSKIEINPFVMSHHMPIVKGTINECDLNFVVDTGMGNNMIDKTIFDSIRGDVNILGQVNLVGVGESALLDQGEVKNLRIGQRMFRNTMTTFANIDHIKAVSDVPIDGLIGYEILSRQKTLLSYHNRRLIFLD